jgi:hypothetical protein
MLLYRSASDWWVQTEPGSAIRMPPNGGPLTTREDLVEYLAEGIRGQVSQPLPQDLLPPMEEQEVWAAGVTYYRSRAARMAESESAGGGDFYDRVYTAERPELFFKATPHRVVGPDAAVRIRRDSKWNVPEPELAVLISPNASILGYTIGNDMSSRDIEGANPLYLPQAKVYDAVLRVGSCNSGHAGAIAGLDRHRFEDPPRRPIGFSWIHHSRSDETASGGTGRVFVSGKLISQWLFPADGHRHRAAGFLFARRWRSR